MKQAQASFGFSARAAHISRGQAALDFLMTYGWALIIIVLVASTLFALGIFDLGSFVGSRSSGFAQIGASGWRVAGNGAFTLMLKNNAGTDINITSINATLGTQNITYSTVTPISNGQQTGIISAGTFASAPSYGGSYVVRVSISYVDTATGFSYLDSGTLTGRVN